MSTEISAAVRRAVVETNLERCRTDAAKNMIEAGRWLNAAKDEGLVPHGEWAQWVSEHAWMNERTAQRMMQAAREIPEGSPLETLGAAKIRALLTLPAPERESFAREIDAKHATSREVEEAVARARAERQKEIDSARASLLKSEAERMRLAAENQKLKDTPPEVIELNRDAAAAQALCNEQAKIIGEYEIQIATQKNIIAKKEQEIDDLTDELDEARVDAARGGMSARAVRDPGSVILSAIGALMAEAGKAPGELNARQGEMDEGTRRLIIGQAQMLGRWAMAVIGACGGEDA